MTTASDAPLGLKWARYYARRGWSVVPVPAGSKIPAVPWAPYQQRRATDDEMAAWWAEDAGAGCGIVTGPISGLVVLDVDGAAGLQSLQEFETEHGALPETASSITGSGGRHFFFTRPADAVKVTNKARIAPGLDIRADGGFVVVPPSLHPNGRRYAWDPGAKIETYRTLPVLPDAILAFTNGHADARTTDGGKAADDGWLAKVIGGVGAGQRNDVAARLVGHFFGRGLAETEVLERMTEWNAHNTPPLTPDELQAVVASITKLRVRTGQAGLYERADGGNALAFVDDHGAEFRFEAGPGRWRHWDGVKWGEDTTGDAPRAAMLTARARLRRAADIVDPHTAREESRWSLISLNSGRVSGSLALASVDSRIVTVPDDYDRHPLLLNCPNGILDLETGRLLEHDPLMMMTRVAGAAFDSQATSPLWEAKLLEIFSGDADLVSFLQRWAGYCLTGHVHEHKLVIATGSGGNGKSVVTNTVRRMLGEYGAAGSFETFCAHKFSRANEARDDLARLQGVRMFTAAEPELSRTFSAAVVKAVTSSDPIVARKSYERPVQFTPSHKTTLSCNTLPRVRDLSTGFWRRIYRLEFLEDFTGCADLTLEDRLAGTELRGILAWSVQGALEWRREGLCPPSKVIMATDAYRQREDVVARFLDERTEADTESVVSAAKLYEAFKPWADRAGEYPMAANWFGDGMSRLGHPSVKRHLGRFYEAFRLLPEVPTDG